MPSRLSSTGPVRIFSNSKYAKKGDNLSEKRESGMALKKGEFTPGSGNVDTYVNAMHCYSCNLGNIQRYTPITVDQTAPFQTRKIKKNRSSEFLGIN